MNPGILNQQQNGPIDRQSLMRGMAILVALLQTLPQDAVAPKQEDDNHFTSRNGSSVGDAGLISFLSDGDNSPLDQQRDSYLSYEERPLKDGRKVRQYENGNTRIYSADGSVIQEERDNGNFMVSLPTGRVLYQEQPGEPLMVIDSATRQPLGMARVVMLQLGEGDPRAAFTFIDGNSAHFVDVENLKYYRMGAAPEEAPAAEPVPMNNVNTAADGRYAWVNWNHMAGPDAKQGPDPTVFNSLRPLTQGRESNRRANTTW